MSIKIYSSYDEFKYEEPEVCDCIEEDSEYPSEDEQEESEDKE